MPETPADLANHDCVAYRHVSSGAIFQWEFHYPGPRGHAFAVEPHGTLTTNDDDSMIRAALQGAGLVQHLDIAVRRPLADGSLVRVLQPWSKPFVGFYLHVPSRDRMPGKVRALMGFLVEKRGELEAAAKQGQAERAASGASRRRRPPRSA